MFDMSVGPSLADIRAQRFSSSGTRQGGEISVSFGVSAHSDLVIQPGGQFHVVWNSVGPPPGGYDIYLTRLSSTGMVEEGLQTNSYTPAQQTAPRIASESIGDFVVVWMTGNYVGATHIGGQRFDSTGARAGAEFQIDVYTPGHAQNPTVAMDADGDFVVVWDAVTQDTPRWIHARHFRSNGVPIASEFVVNANTSGYQYSASVSMSATGDFVVVWQAANKVLGRRFAAVPDAGPLDVDGSGGTPAPLTDGLLILRYLFGFRGAIPVRLPWHDAHHRRGGRRLHALHGGSDRKPYRRAPLTGAHSRASPIDRARAATYDARHTERFVAMRTVRRIPLLALSALIHALAVGAIATEQAGSRQLVARGTDPVEPDLAPKTGELHVNTFTANPQRNPDVAGRSDGSFVVVWENRPGADPFDYDIIARRFSSTGVPIGGELQVNTFTSSSQNDPHVAADDTGNFVVVWWSPGVNLYPRVMARRFSSSGTPLSDEIQVNTYTTTGNDSPDLAIAPDGRFLVVWDSFPDGSQEGVRSRLFDSAGSPLATELQLNTYITDHQIDPAVAVDGSGRFVVVWRSTGQDGSFDGAFGRRLDSNGAPVGAEFQINTITAGVQTAPAVAAADEGTFLVSWSSTQGPSPSDVFLRRYSSSGVPQAVEFLINTYTTNNQYLSSVAALETGDFVVTWSSYRDGQAFDVVARRLTMFGAVKGNEIQINVHTPGNQNHSAIAGDGVGGFVVTWDSVGQDGDQYGVFARRYVTLALLDIDGDDVLGPLTDGLLVLRFLFGFSGPTLVNGAVAGGCARCTAGAIGTYLQSFGSVLDVDGNASIMALEDGLLVLRYLFGFTGSSLTNGAVGAGCTRCDPTSVAAYLSNLTSPV
jgi:hypothetical protein